MAGVTDEGFVIKRTPELKADLDAKAIELFQDKVAPGDIVDVSSSSTLGRLIGLIIPSLADLWEAAQGDYSAFDPNSATGIALDNLVQYTGISRFAAAPTTAIGLFSGDNNTLIPDGSTVSASDTNKRFVVVGSVALSPSLASGIIVTVGSVLNATNYSVSYTTAGSLSTNTATYTSGLAATVSEILNGLKSVIDGAHPLLSASVVGSTLVVDRADVFQTSTFSVSSNLIISKVKKLGDLQCTENGDNEQATGTINTIVTPVLGWDSVTNPISASPGRVLETDEELRIRFRNTKLERSSNILDSLVSALRNLEGVEEVAIYENDTDVTDANGVSPHSFLPVVNGGSSQLIAETIWKNKPMGISSEGNTVISITDSQGFPHDIGFERPNPVTIYIDIVLSLNPEDSQVFPGDGEDQIKQAILDYADANFGIGDDVIFSRLYTPINTVPGHQIDSLEIGTAPGPTGTSNIVINFNQIASFAVGNVSIIVS